MTDLPPSEQVRAEIRATWGLLAGGLRHEDVEAAGWTPTGDRSVDLPAWCATYDLVVARRCVTWLRQSPGHVGADGWRRAVERYRARVRRSA